MIVDAIEWSTTLEVVLSKQYVWMQSSTCIVVVQSWKLCKGERKVIGRVFLLALSSLTTMKNCILFDTTKTINKIAYFSIV